MQSTSLVFLYIHPHGLACDRSADHPLELRDLAADDIQTGAPEVRSRDVGAEAAAEGDGIGHACGGERVVVPSFEGFRGRSVLREQPQAKEKTEGIGVIVERVPCNVVMADSDTSTRHQFGQLFLGDSDLPIQRDARTCQ